MTTQTVIDLHHCSARKSHRIVVANTPAAEAAFLAYYTRRDLELRTPARSYGDLNISIWGADDSEMSANVGTPGADLDKVLFPTCEHGMNWHSCYGPDHFMSREDEIARGEY